MEEWMRLPVSQLKRLVKGRAGRIAELQMEIKILEGVIEKKVREGDLGGSSPGEERERPAKKAGFPKEEPQKEEDSEDADGEEAGGEEAGTSEEKPEEPEKESKIKEKSSDHAFREID